MRPIISIIFYHRPGGNKSHAPLQKAFAHETATLQIYMVSRHLSMFPGKSACKVSGNVVNSFGMSEICAPTSEQRRKRITWLKFATLQDAKQKVEITAPTRWTLQNVQLNLTCKKYAWWSTGNLRKFGSLLVLWNQEKLSAFNSQFATACLSGGFFVPSKLFAPLEALFLVSALSNLL